MRMSRRAEHLERRARGGHGGRVDLRRHHEAESVFPQRVAGDQDPVLGRCRTRARPCRGRAPRARCHSRSPQTCVVPAGRTRSTTKRSIALVAVVVEQRLAVPALDERRLRRRHCDRTTVLAGDRRVAANVIRVAMRVDERRKSCARRGRARSRAAQSERRMTRSSPNRSARGRRGS